MHTPLDTIAHTDDSSAALSRLIHLHTLRPVDPRDHIASIEDAVVYGIVAAMAHAVDPSDADAISRDVVALMMLLPEYMCRECAEVADVILDIICAAPRPPTDATIAVPASRLQQVH